jgi:hypothetical protein
MNWTNGHKYYMVSAGKVKPDGGAAGCALYFLRLLEGSFGAQDGQTPGKDQSFGGTTQWNTRNILNLQAAGVSFWQRWDLP